MVGHTKSWDDVLLQEREENSRLRQQQRDQAERERRLVQRLAQLREQQQALQQGKTVDAVGRDSKIKTLQVRDQLLLQSVLLFRVFCVRRRAGQSRRMLRVLVRHRAAL